MSRRTEKPFWDPDELRALLQTKVLGRNLILFNRVTSTNALLKRLAHRGAAHGTTVLADEQTSGRGRFGRKWQSPPEQGLWFSFLLRPQLPVEKVGIISLAIAALVADTLTHVCAQEFRVKWPNDVLVAGKKVCGILCETQMSPARVEALIAGVGLNVAQTRADFAPEWRGRATSLQLAGCSNCDRKLLFAKLLQAFDQNLCTDLTQRLPELMARWCARCEGLGSPITIAHMASELGGLHESTTGIFAGIGDGGELLLRMPAGDLRFFSAGEITLPRSVS